LINVPGLPIGAGPATLARMGRTVYRFASVEHLRKSEEQLEEAESGSKPEPIEPASALLERGLGAEPTAKAPRRLGFIPGKGNQQQILVVRVDFSDLPGDPQALGGTPVYTVPVLQTLADQVAAYYRNSSYGQVALNFTVTPSVYRLPGSASYYAVNGAVFMLYNDATAAVQADFPLANYDQVIVLFSDLALIPGSQIRFGGAAVIGTSQVWVNGEFDFRVVAHELGHSLGLYHANFWQCDDGNPISDKGYSVEYLDPFDTMGSNQGNDTRTDFNPWFKHQLNWIQDSQVQTVTNSGTYRVYRFDDAQATGTLALKVSKDSGRDYWVACRRNFTDSSTMQHGAYIVWGYNGPRQSNLIGVGTPPNSRFDAALGIGATLADPEANLAIAAVAEGGEAPGQYLDVQIGLGPPPEIITQVEDQFAVEGQRVEFTVVATGNPAPGFTWQRQARGTTIWTSLTDGADFSGSGTAALVVNQTTCSMSGDRFRCWLTNSAGGFNSSQSALLSVNRFGMSILAGQSGSSGHDGPAPLSEFTSPMGIALDHAGNVYVADTGNHVIRKITPTGTVTTLAGLTGNTGSTDGNGANARFDFPMGITVDREDNIYVADYLNSTIRKVTPDGWVTTMAGLAANAGSLDATGSAARFNHPYGVAVDCLGDLYVADTGNQTIRKITSEGVVNTLAGLAGKAGATDGAGSDALFNHPLGIAVDTAGTILVADQNNSTIRRITPEGLVTTLAGSAGLVGSVDAAGSSARFSSPSAIAVDLGDNLYIADRNNSAVRMITPEGIVTTLAGSVNSDGTPVGAFSPSGLAVDGQGNVYVADSYANTIRLIQTGLAPLPFLRMAAAGDQLVLSWTASAEGYVLERSSVLSGEIEWTPVVSEASVIGCNFVVTVPIDAPAAFFRLHRP
jgi:sugar lactone lactonase YvrE